MPGLKKQALYLAAALLLTVAGTHNAAAEEIMLTNDTDEDFAAIYCVNDQGETRQVTGELAGGESITVTPDELPEYECSRLAVRLPNVEGWQFYHEPEPAAAQKIIFGMNKVEQQEAEVPMLLIESGGESYVALAGIPMSHLTQLMESGIDNDKWREIITPHTDPEVTTSYLVSFAEVSWDLQGEPNFVDLDSGGQKLKELILAAPFGNRTLAAIFEGLKEFSLAPSLVGSESLSDDQPADERWEVAENALEQAANNGEGMVLFIFSSDNLLVSLTLDLDSSTAVIGLALPE